MLIRCAVSRREGTTLRRQRRFAKYESELLQCGSDIQSLERFVGAQVVAFRKILKKYRKWTGSSTLGSRFRDTVLSHPKSFTKRDFSHLQSEQEDLMVTIRDAFPTDGDCSASPGGNSSAASLRPSVQLSPSDTIVAPEPRPMGYWNEYDNGSEAGDRERGDDGTYTIYVNPDEDLSFPGVSTLTAIFKAPMRRINSWVRGRHRSTDEEHGPLLADPPMQYGTGHTDDFAQAADGAVSDTEAEDDNGRGASPARRGSYGYASSEDFPIGYKPYYAAIPSVEEQQLARYTERTLFWLTWICFGVSFLLMGIASLLIKTGRHKMQLEVDAGVTLGIMSSLGAACAALGLTFSRREPPGWATVVGVWVVFWAACVLNGILLVLVVGNTPLKGN